MTTFFRKRPPYASRTPHNPAADDDVPVIGPASAHVDESDYPILEAEPEPIDDFPIVGPAADDAVVQEEQEEDIPIAAPAAPISTKQFTPSDKLRLPEAPDWVQEQARSLHHTAHHPLEDAIELIINDELAHTEQRIRQRIFDELKKHH
ncbi:Uncharacterised protein [Oligella ureolytica]|uniref:Uncharacterized protein n=1 Tax=Oligella ureolytica TaxID=90244 RepID=A0A378XHG4_9BURK|nr:hypothetical protein [Oligella ureolytica]QPT39639.1 hypothetical protein I6G29_10930 [Oligella ureolytica]SUA52587.1 Uncharacterised protein [Oligella ureolytica]SUA57033.1 Uncharacterised protein [Oligella ureolytica]